MSNELEHLRKQIDEVDRRLVDILSERDGLVTQVVATKLTGDARLRDMHREEDLLTRLVDRGKAAGLDGFYVTRVFREVLDHSIRLQQEHVADHHDPARGNSRTIRVAFQGTEGSYSHMAAMKHFGSRDADVIYEGWDTFRNMLEAVLDGEVNYAVLPIENTTAGSINESYDLLARMNLALVGEEAQRVEHCLVGLEPVPLSHIRRVYSHPQALAQCSEFLASLHHCKVEAFTDTALAVAKIKQERDLSQAAIASEQAARIYGLPILKQDIANQRENYTRMVIVAKEAVRYDFRIPCKTSLILATRHEQGALAKCLDILAKHELNLTKLESRPRSNTPWQYLFYADFEGNIADAHVKAAVEELASQTSYLRVLGSYPSRTTKEMLPAEPKPGAVRSEAPPPAESVAPPAPSPKAPKDPVVQIMERKPYKLASRANRRDDTIIVVGSVTIGGPKPVVFAGPCAVESREQIFSCARIVKELGGDILRGGCFKPRTSPYSFQGHGYQALEWMAEAGREYSLPIITEVLHPADVEKVAQKADILQIGARNMQNFALLKEIGVVDRPVMLKRGMMASIDEWLQAAEYILAHGNQQVILCERGIRTFETATRNTLDLSAVPVTRELTHLPVTVDPSHAVGVRRWIIPMAEASLASGANGVMVEIHPDPSQALSDGPQALLFSDFEELMRRISALNPILVADATRTHTPVSAGQ